MSYLENSLNFSNSINVLESEIPAKYRHEVYDICLISAVEDAVERNKFAQILKKFIRLSDKSEPKIVSVDERGSDDSAYNDRILDTVKDAFENSSYIFYYLTPNYQKWNKGELFKDEGLINSFRTNKNCIVPVFAVTKQGQKNKVPYGLRSYKGIDLHTLLKRRNLKVCTYY